jgi:phage terminase small subunit
MADELTPKQQRFVEEYLVDLNATQAAIRAGYSQDTAHAIGWENLRKPEISEAIVAAQKARSERTQIDAAWILKRLAIEATADLADLYDDKGVLRPIGEWPMIWRQGLVAGLETQQLTVGDGEDKKPFATVHKVKLSDRIRRLELLGKHIAVGAFAERHEHTGKDGGPIETADVTDNELARRIAFVLSGAVERKDATH